MKLKGWIIIIASILIVAYLFIRIDTWAGGWKDLFFYFDDWKVWILIAALVWAIKGIFEWMLKAEVRLLQ